MSETKIKFGDVVNVPLGGYMFTQVALLIAQYGFKLDMPRWVVWFPSIVLGGVFGVALCILLVWIIVVVIKAWRE